MSTARLLETVTLFGGLLLTLVVLFVPITVGLVLIQRWLGEERLARLLGGDRLVTAVVKGTVLGAVTPFCGCSTIPLLLGLLRARVRFAGVAAFMLASPLLNPYILGVVALLFGGRTTVVYAAVAAGTSMVLAVVWEASGLERHLADHVRPAPVVPGAHQPEPTAVTPGARIDLAHAAGSEGGVDLAHAAGSEGGATGGGTAPCDDGACDASVPREEGHAAPPRPWAGWRAELTDAGQAAVDLVRPMLRPMALGVGIGAVLYGVIPDGWLAHVLGGSSWWSLPVAALLGLPLYLRGEAAFPIGAGLLAAGVGQGPMFAMVIAGMGASLPEVTILSGIFRPRLLAAFLASVFAMAVVGGALIPAAA